MALQSFYKAVPNARKVQSNSSYLWYIAKESVAVYNGAAPESVSKETNTLIQFSRFQEQQLYENIYIF